MAACNDSAVNFTLFLASKCKEGFGAGRFDKDGQTRSGLYCEPPAAA
jgi:hypothetical protein